MKGIIALCDRQVEYVHRLMEYINHKHSIPIKAAAFSEEESVIEYGSKSKIDLLVVSENMMDEKIMAIDADKKAALMESRNSSRAPVEKCIYKYQSAENVVREIMSLYEAESRLLTEDTKWRQRKKIIGVYSPVGGSSKSAFAIALGQILSRRKPVLYMNLEAFSGIGEMLGISESSGLSDLLYYSSRPTADPISKLPVLTISVQNLDIIPPAQSPQDLHEVTSGKWKEIFASIMSKSAYETLVVELGNEIADIADIMDYCSVVYVPIREDAFAKAKIDEFNSYIKGEISDEEKIQKVKLPFYNVTAAGKEFYENLIWSELGDYIRRLIQEEGEFEKRLPQSLGL